MKLGTETGSVINHLQSRAVIGQPEPEVGMGVTLLHWTDRSAGTIVAVKTVGKALIIEITEDDAKVVAGSSFDGTAEYEFTSRPDASRLMYRREANGKWVRVGFKVTDYVQKEHVNVDGTKEMRTRPVMSKRLSKIGGAGLVIGQRDAYRDPSF
jgi:hypothetical protein